MKKSLLAAAIALLALNANATEEEAVAALTARLEADPLAKVRKALGVEANVTEEVLVTACAALKTKAEATTTAAEPDPAKFVPISVVEDLKKDFAALSAKVQGDDVEKLVEKGLADGRLLKGQAEWARSLGKKDIAALTAYLDTAQPIAALTATQTGNRRDVVVDKDNNLTDAELAVCAATGIAPKDFAAAKA